MQSEGGDFQDIRFVEVKQTEMGSKLTGAPREQRAGLPSAEDERRRSVSFSLLQILTPLPH